MQARTSAKAASGNRTTRKIIAAKKTYWPGADGGIRAIAEMTANGTVTMDNSTQNGARLRLLSEWITVLGKVS